MKAVQGGVFFMVPAVPPNRHNWIFQPGDLNMTSVKLCRWAMAFVLPIVLLGCGSGGPTGDLDALTTDSNGDGFLDVTPPDGVEFLSLDNMKVRLRNTVSQDELGALAAGFGVEPAMLNLVDIVAEIAVELDYGAVTQVLAQDEAIEPFEHKFEIACADVIELSVDVIANVPLVGPQNVSDFNFELVEGMEYNCGQTIELEVFINEGGDPDVLVDIQ
jgi:hypothetical protein